MIPNGDTPERIKNHPLAALEGVDAAEHRRVNGGKLADEGRGAESRIL